MSNRFIKIIFFIIISSCWCACDKAIDNYSAPNGGVHGNVIDKQTNEPIPLPVGDNSGVLVSMYEQNTNSTVAITYRAGMDGSYTNTLLFDGYYRINVAGPYIGVCEGYVTIKGQTSFDLYALPFSRIQAEASISDDNKITIAYDVERVDESFTLSDISVIWNYVPGVDNNASNYATKVSVGTVTNGTYTIDLLNDINFVQNYYKIQSNNNKVYVRVSATVNNTVNYSKVIELTVK